MRSTRFPCAIPKESGDRSWPSPAPGQSPVIIAGLGPGRKNAQVLNRRSSIRSFAACSVALVLVSCSCAVPIPIAGSLQGGLLFDFGETIKVAHANVTVFQGNSETVVWEIQGSAKIGALQYGVAPGNSTANVEPTPLEAGETYLLTVTTSTFIGPPCGGAILFTIDSNGYPVKCRNLEACAAKQDSG